MGGLKTEIDILYNALIHGPAVQITRQPTGVIGSALTGSGMTTGAFDYAAAGANQVQLIAAGANAAGIWICGGGLENPSITTDETWVLWFGRGTAPAGVLAGEIQFDCFEITAVGEWSWPTVCFPIPLFVTAGVGIALDLANGTAVDVTANGYAMLMTGLGA